MIFKWRHHMSYIQAHMLALYLTYAIGGPSYLQYIICCYIHHWFIYIHTLVTRTNNRFGHARTIQEQNDLHNLFICGLSLFIFLLQNFSSNSSSSCIYVRIPKWLTFLCFFRFNFRNLWLQNVNLRYKARM